jgi:hypothetical protein
MAFATADSHRPGYPERVDMTAGITSRLAKRLFDEPFWPTKRLLSWVSFRHEAGLKASLNAGSEIVARVSLLQRDFDPAHALLRALQEGDIAGLKDGKELAREFWAGMRGNELPPVYFRREDVLTVWPRLALEKRKHGRPAGELSGKRDLGAPTSRKVLLSRNKRGKDPKKMNEAIAAMMAAVEGGEISEFDLAQMKQKRLSDLYGNAGRTVLAEARRRALVEIAEQNADIKATNDK